jgi:hypothetical protein
MKNVKLEAYSKNETKFRGNETIISNNNMSCFISKMQRKHKKTWAKYDSDEGQTVL